MSSQLEAVSSFAAQTLSALVRRQFALDVGDLSSRAALILLVDVFLAFDELAARLVSTRVSDLEDNAALGQVRVDD
jgi:hypothetical protein